MAIQKAKDLISQDEDETANKPQEEEDQVTAAYESISKKLESLRKGESPKDEIEEIEERPELTVKTHEDLIAQKPEEDEDEIDPLDEEVPGDKIDEDEVEDPLDDVKEPEDDLRKPNKKIADEQDPDSKEEPEEDEPEEPAIRQRPTLMEETPKEVQRPTMNRMRPDDLEEQKPVTARKEQRFEALEHEEPDSLDDLTHEPIPSLRKVPQEEYSNPSYKPQSKVSFSSMDQTQSDHDPNKFFNRHQTQSPPRKSSKWHLLILILIGLSVIGGTVYLLKKQFKETSAPSPSPQAAIVESSPIPSPSPIPTLDKSSVKVRILNGTGKSGLAGTVSTKLKELGYKIDKTGNATSSSVEQTSIKSKTSVATGSAVLVTDLAPEYSAQVSDSNLKDNDSADFEVTLGTK